MWCTAIALVVDALVLVAAVRTIRYGRRKESPDAPWATALGYAALLAASANAIVVLGGYGYRRAAWGSSPTLSGARSFTPLP